MRLAHSCPRQPRFSDNRALYATLLRPVQPTARPPALAPSAPGVAYPSRADRPRPMHLFDPARPKLPNGTFLLNFCNIQAIVPILTLEPRPDDLIAITVMCKLNDDSYKPFSQILHKNQIENFLSAWTDDPESLLIQFFGWIPKLDETKTKNKNETKPETKTPPKNSQLDLI